MGGGLRNSEPGSTGFRVLGLGFWVWGIGFRVKDIGFRVLGVGFRVWGQIGVYRFFPNEFREDPIS